MLDPFAIGRLAIGVLRTGLNGRLPFLSATKMSGRTDVFSRGPEKPSYFRLNTGGDNIG